MPLHHLYHHLRKKGIDSHRPLYLAALLLFFFTLFDGILAYAVPLMITQRGFSATQMGMILGFSSLAGALFDFVISKVLKEVHFRRLYLLMISVGLLYSIILWQAKTIPLFLLAMSIWGLYYDLKNFSNYDFISRQTKKQDHVSSLGVIDVFKCLGYLIAPLIAGLTIADTVSQKSFEYAWIFLLTASLFYFILAIVTRRTGEVEPLRHKTIKKGSIRLEFRLWKSIGKQLLPLLGFTFLFNMYDAFFWTLGPLLADSFHNSFGGELVLSVYALPGLITGWFVGSLTKKYGNLPTAYAAYGLGSLLLILMVFTNTIVWFVLAVTFLSSFAIASSVPAIQGEYVDTITRNPEAEGEIEGLADFFTNMGYVIGPMLAGFISDQVGNGGAFGVLGITGVVAIFLMYKASPKQVRLHLPRG